MTFKADLHCHTTCSDGSFSPTEIIDLALEKKLNALSITDHDTLKAYETAIPYAKSKGLILIPGIEFSTEHDDESVHVLAYSFHPENEEILHYCRLHQTRRQQRIIQIIERLQSLGISITADEVRSLAGESIGRPHIALVLIKNGYVSTIQEAFHEYLGEGKKAFVKSQPFSTQETLDLIHRANGLAIMAHPHLIKADSLFLKLLKLPFDGMECYYGKFPQNKHNRYLKIAERRKLLITGGSDFHGSVKPDIPLGCSFVDEERLAPLLERVSLNSFLP